MRRCICAKGSGAPSFHASTSPSSAVPSGNRSPSASISGNGRSSAPLRATTEMFALAAGSAAPGCRPISIRTCHSARFAQVLYRLPRDTPGRTDKARNSTSRVSGPTFRRDQRSPESRRGPPIAHQPGRSRFRGQSAGRRDGPHHQVLRHAHAEFAGDQLVPHEALALVHVAPRRYQPRAAGFVVETGKRQQPLLHPIAERQWRRSAGSGSSSAMVSAKSPTAEMQSLKANPARPLRR